MAARALSATALPCALQAVLVGVLALPSSAAPQELGKRWEDRNDRGNRFEGLREIPVSRPDFELLSFLAHQEDYEQDVELKVLFFLPEEGPATVFAQELREEKQYWMKSKPESWTPGAWNQLGPWPTHEVLDREGIPSWNLGVYVEVASEEELLLAPAVLYHTEPPRRIELYTLQLRPNWSLTRLEYTVRRAGGEGDEVLLEGRRLREMRLGEPVALDLEAAELPKEWLRLEAVGSVKNRVEKAYFECRFFHQAEVVPPP